MGGKSWSVADLSAVRSSFQVVPVVLSVDLDTDADVDVDVDFVTDPDIDSDPDSDSLDASSIFEEVGIKFQGDRFA